MHPLSTLLDHRDAMSVPGVLRFLHPSRPARQAETEEDATAEPCGQGIRGTKRPPRVGGRRRPAIIQAVVVPRASIELLNTTGSHGGRSTTHPCWTQLRGLLVRQAYLLACGIDYSTRRRFSWTGRVSRIVLFAGVNRGVNPLASRVLRIWVWVARAFPPLRQMLAWHLR